MNKAMDLFIAFFLIFFCLFFTACGELGEPSSDPLNRSSSSNYENNSSSSNTNSSSSNDFNINLNWQDPPEKSVVHGTVKVELDPYMISKNLITQGQYKSVMNDNPSKGTKDDNYPVEGVSWFKAVEFCEKLSVLLGLSENAIRLPTEAEWEYAVCSSNDYVDCPLESAVNRNTNYWEWTNDCYDSDFPYNGISKNPSGPPCLSSNDRVRKGLTGYFYYRYATSPYLTDISGAYIGFRVIVRKEDYFEE